MSFFISMASLHQSKGFLSRIQDCRPFFEFSAARAVTNRCAFPSALALALNLELLASISRLSRAGLEPAFSRCMIWISTFLIATLLTRFNTHGSAYVRGGRGFLPRSPQGRRQPAATIPKPKKIFLSPIKYLHLRGRATMLIKKYIDLKRPKLFLLL